MRDILFRGMTENKVWKYGYYWKRSDVDYLHYIIDEGYNNVMVLPETIGQYTGFCDKNRKKIFEGDIVKTRYFGKDDGNGHNFNDYDTFVVKWDNSGFCIESKTRKYSIYEDDESIEVIGNIYENKELLEAVYG